jgi:hypothetical protein
MMSAGGALRTALVDLYHQSWRLLILNSALSAFVGATLLAALWVPPVALLLVLAGPLAAALMHCAVTLVRTDELELGDAVTGLRLHWRRGLALGLVLLVVLTAGVFALVFYARTAWPLAILVGDILVLFAVLQLVLWPLAVHERTRKLRAVVRDAAVAILERPLASIALALALLVVNLAGAAAAVLPLLTLTVAYSFLAAAHFALPLSAREV